MMNELPPLQPLGLPQEAVQFAAAIVPLVADAAQAALTGDGLTKDHAKGTVANQAVTLIPEHDTGAAALEAAGVTHNNQGQVGDEQAMEVIDNFLLTFTMLQEKSPIYDDLLGKYEKWISSEEQMKPVEKRQLKLDIYKTFYRMTQAIGQLEIYNAKTRTYNEAYLPILQEAMMNFSSTQKRILTDADVPYEPKLARLLKVLGCKTISDLQKKVGAAVDGKFSFDTLFHAQAFALQQTARGLQSRAAQELTDTVQKAKKAMTDASSLAKEYRATSSADFWTTLKSDPTQVSADQKKLLAKFDITLQNGQVAIHGELATPDKALAHVKAHYAPLIEAKRAEADHFLKSFDAEFAVKGELLPPDEQAELLAFRKAVEDEEKTLLGQPDSGDRSPMHHFRRGVVRVQLLVQPDRLDAVKLSVETGTPVDAKAERELAVMGVTVERKANGTTSVKVNGQEVDQKTVVHTLDLASRGVRSKGPSCNLWKLLAKANKSVAEMGVLIAERDALMALIKNETEKQASPVEQPKAPAKKAPAPGKATADSPPPSPKATAPLAGDPAAPKTAPKDAVPLFDPLLVAQQAEEFRREQRERMQAHLDAKHEKAQADYDEAADAKAAKKREANKLARVETATVQQGDGQPVVVQKAIAQDGSTLGPEKASPDLAS